MLQDVIELVFLIKVCIHHVCACSASYNAACAAGRVAQLEPQLARVEQRAEELRAELQNAKQSCTSLSQQVSDLEGAAAMHSAQQVGPLTCAS